MTFLFVYLPQNVLCCHPQPFVKFYSTHRNWISLYHQLCIVQTCISKFMFWSVNHMTWHQSYSRPVSGVSLNLIVIYTVDSLEQGMIPPFKRSPFVLSHSFFEKTWQEKSNVHSFFQRNAFIILKPSTNSRRRKAD